MPLPFIKSKEPVIDKKENSSPMKGIFDVYKAATEANRTADTSVKATMRHGEVKGSLDIIAYNTRLIHGDIIELLKLEKENAAKSSSNFNFSDIAKLMLPALAGALGLFAPEIAKEFQLGLKAITTAIKTIPSVIGTALKAIPLALKESMTFIKNIPSLIKEGFTAMKALPTVLKDTVAAVKAGSIATSVGKVGATIAKAASGGLSGVKSLLTSDSTAKARPSKLTSGLSLGMIGGRLMQGDYTGAAMESASYATNFIGGKYGRIAKLAGLGMDGAIIGRDYSKRHANDDKASEDVANETTPTPANVDTIEAAKQDDTGLGAVGTGAAVGGAALVGGKLVKSIMPAKSLGSAVANVGVKGAAKAGAKIAAKSLPFVGAAIGAGFAAARAIDGDFKGAALEVVSGLASFVPIIGTAGAVAIQAGLAVRDSQRDMEKSSAQQVTTLAQSTVTANDAITKGTVQSQDALTQATQQTLASTIAATLAVQETSTTGQGVLTLAAQEANASSLAASAAITGSTAASALTMSQVGTTATDTMTSTSKSLIGTIGSFCKSIFGMVGAVLKPIASLIKSVTGFIMNNPIVNAGKDIVNSGIDAVKDFVSRFNPFGSDAPTGAAGSGVLLPNSKGTMTTAKTNENQMKVYSAFLNSGFSESQAKIMTAEVGRENGYQDKYMYGTHADAANTKTNQGFFSWQGDRKEKLVARMKEKGLVNKDGTFKQSQESLNEQAAFAKWEMENDKTYSKTKKGFLENKNISESEGHQIVGKDYIRWAIDNQKYRGNGLQAIADHTANLNKQLGKKGAVTGAQAVNSLGAKTDMMATAASGVTATGVPALLAKPSSSTPAPTPAKTGGSGGGGSTPTVTGGSDSGKSGAEDASAKSADWDLDKLVATAMSNAKSKAGGQCAKYVRDALESAQTKKIFSGGLGHARDYSTSLQKLGWVQVGGNGTPAMKGDIIVFPRTSGKNAEYGHVCIFTGSGTKWVSDFVQGQAQPNKSSNHPYVQYRAKSGVSNGVGVSGTAAGEGVDSNGNPVSQGGGFLEGLASSGMKALGASGLLETAKEALVSVFDTKADVYKPDIYKAGKADFVNTNDAGQLKKNMGFDNKTQDNKGTYEALLNRYNDEGQRLEYSNAGELFRTATAGFNDNTTQNQTYSGENVFSSGSSGFGSQGNNPFSSITSIIGSAKSGDILGAIKGVMGTGLLDGTGLGGIIGNVLPMVEQFKQGGLQGVFSDVMSSGSDSGIMKSVSGIAGQLGLSKQAESLNSVIATSSKTLSELKSINTTGFSSLPSYTNEVFNHKTSQYTQDVESKRNQPIVIQQSPQTNNISTAGQSQAPKGVSVPIRVRNGDSIIREAMVSFMEKTM